MGRGVNMTFQLFGTDWYTRERFFGFWIGGLKNNSYHRNLFCIYWADRELLIDLFWIRVCTIFI